MINLENWKICKVLLVVIVFGGNFFFAYIVAVFIQLGVNTVQYARIKNSIHLEFVFPIELFGTD